jgi:hypothetical protein
VTIPAGWPWTLAGLLAVIVGLLSFYGVAWEAETVLATGINIGYWPFPSPAKCSGPPLILGVVRFETEGGTVRNPKMRRTAPADHLKLPCVNRGHAQPTRYG